MTLPVDDPAVLSPMFEAIGELIKAHIRARPERNGIPLYYLSDHGNLHRGRAIRLRVLRAPILAGGEA